MWNKNEMSKLDATLARLPLTLTFDLDLWPWIFRSNCISGMGGPIVMERKGRDWIGCPDVKHQGNESTGCCTDGGVLLTFTFDLEFSWSNCISGMGGPIVMERKGREWIGCRDVKHNHNEAEDTKSRSFFLGLIVLKYILRRVFKCVHVTRVLEAYMR